MRLGISITFDVFVFLLFFFAVIHLFSLLEYGTGIIQFIIFSCFRGQEEDGSGAGGLATEGRGFENTSSVELPSIFSFQSTGRPAKETHLEYFPLLGGVVHDGSAHSYHIPVKTSVRIFLCTVVELGLATFVDNLIFAFFFFGLVGCSFIFLWFAVSLSLHSRKIWQKKCTVQVILTPVQSEKSLASTVLG